MAQDLAAQLARELADVKRRLQSVERASQLANTSVELYDENGAIIVNAPDGTPVVQIGGLGEGNGYGIQAVNGGKVWADAVPDELITEIAEQVEIADGAVTEAKLAADAVTETKIADDAVSSPKIVAGAIQASHMDVDSVNSSAIVAGAVTAGKIGALAVTAGTIAADAVTANEIAANAITATELAADAVTAGKIAANAVEAGDIAANAVTAGTIAAGVIGTNQLAAEAVTADKIAVKSLAAAQVVIGLGGEIIPDGSFEDPAFRENRGGTVGTGNWFFVNTLSSDGDWALWKEPFTAAYTGVILIRHVPVIPGEQYVLSYDAYPHNNPNGVLAWYFHYYDAEGTKITTQTVSVSTASGGTWTRRGVLGPATSVPAGGVSMTVEIVDSSTHSTGAWGIDNVSLRLAQGADLPDVNEGSVLFTPSQWAPLVVGNPSGAHMRMDGNEIVSMGSDSGTSFTRANLFINALGIQPSGDMFIGTPGAGGTVGTLGRGLMTFNHAYSGTWNIPVTPSIVSPLALSGMTWKVGRAYRIEIMLPWRMNNTSVLLATLKAGSTSGPVIVDFGGYPGGPSPSAYQSLRTWGIVVNRGGSDVTTSVHMTVAANNTAGKDPGIAASNTNPVSLEVYDIGDATYWPNAFDMSSI